MLDGLNFGGVDLGGTCFDRSKQVYPLGDLPTPPSRWQLAAEAAEQRGEQAELLAKLIERQDAMIEEQRRQAEEGRKDRRWAVATAIIAGATLAATILVPISMRWL